MDKVFVAKRVANKLFETEAAVDGAMVQASELMSEMLKARQDINVSMVFADDVQVKMMEAMKALSEARTAMVAVHNELNEAKLRLVELVVHSDHGGTRLAEGLDGLEHLHLHVVGEHQRDVHVLTRLKHFTEQLSRFDHSAIDGGFSREQLLGHALGHERLFHLDTPLELPDTR